MKRLLTMALALGCLLGCATRPAKTPSGAVLTDMMGREVQLSGKAERVVVLTAADAEILYALGAGDAIVGRGEYCDYPEEILNLPVLSSGRETNVEQVLALSPDLIIMDDMDQSIEQVQQMESAGIPVVMTDAHDLDGVYTAIRLVGAAVGRDAAAEALISDMQAALGALRDKAPGRKSLYAEVSPLEYGLWAAGKGSFIDEIAAMLGLDNIFADAEGWAEVSEEQVIARDPDIIVTVTMYAGGGPTPTEEILARPGWQDMRAVKNGAVYALDADILTRPGPRLVQAAEVLYALAWGN